jgi:hypothetical protein
MATVVGLTVNDEEDIDDRSHHVLFRYGRCLLFSLNGFVRRSMFHSLKLNAQNYCSEDMPRPLA